MILESILIVSVIVCIMDKFTPDLLSSILDCIISTVYFGFMALIAFGALYFMFTMLLLTIRVIF